MNTLIDVKNAKVMVAGMVENLNRYSVNVTFIDYRVFFTISVNGRDP